MWKPYKNIRGQIVTFNLYNYSLSMLTPSNTRMPREKKRKLFDNDRFTFSSIYVLTGLLAVRSTRSAVEHIRLTGLLA